MSDTPSANSTRSESLATRSVSSIGELADHQLNKAHTSVSSVGGVTLLLAQTLKWSWRSVFESGVRLRKKALFEQMVRIGVESISIVMIVQVFIGGILALQIAPTLEKYGQVEKVADIVAIAIVRELGPMLTAIVLSGFAGASIAAEIAAMVESEEIKALRAHALDPIHFLIVPRFWASVVMIVGLTVIADVIGITGGLLTAWGVLDISPNAYLDATQQALVLPDLITGLFKAAVFGGLVAMIACYEGLNVHGGAAGVGRATTTTVVKSIVAIIGTDAVFTATFYSLGW